MTSVGIYIDGPNIERGLYEADEVQILKNIGSIIMEYAKTNGTVIESYVFVDENTQWREENTKINYELNGFKFIESKAFKYYNSGGGYIYGKSLTDPKMYCFLMDRIHDPDCPEIFIIVTVDKDITVPLEYIKSHEKNALIIGESNTMSGYLISRCNELGFTCHSLQLMSHLTRYDEVAAMALETPEPKKRKCRPNQNKSIRPNQMNPNNPAYWISRGVSDRPDDWEERLKKEKDE